mmetsp:Transcript_32291/g.65826  ORF Transcript_32291/g.65826 Transcript_32291/m.65826 type:complete len:114 (-) Transcript_32291:111-452(-)
MYLQLQQAPLKWQCSPALCSFFFVCPLPREGSGSSRPKQAGAVVEKEDVSAAAYECSPYLQLLRRHLVIVGDRGDEQIPTVTAVRSNSHSFQPPLPLLLPSSQPPPLPHPQPP